MALSLTKAVGVDPTNRLGSLSDAEVKRLEEALDDPLKAGLPKWMLNHRKDPITGGDHHLLASDLDIRTKRRTRAHEGNPELEG
jgi:small subunit ribosomal protein S13